MVTHAISGADFPNIIKEHKIVFTDVWATWCPPCRAFGPIYEKVSGDHPDIYFTKMDIDDNQQFAQDEGIQSIPTIIAAVDGKIVYKKPGSLKAADLEALINDVRSGKL